MDIVTYIPLFLLLPTPHLIQAHHIYLSPLPCHIRSSSPTTLPSRPTPLSRPHPPLTPPLPTHAPTPSTVLSRPHPYHAPTPTTPLSPPHYPLMPTHPLLPPTTPHAPAPTPTTPPHTPSRPHYPSTQLNATLTTTTAGCNSPYCFCDLTSISSCIICELLSSICNPSSLLVIMSTPRI